MWWNIDWLDYLIFFRRIDIIDFEEINSYLNLKVSEEDECYKEEVLLKIKKDIFSEYNIKNINNKYEVIKKVFDRFKDKYISNENGVKNVYNKSTDMDVEIWKSGIKETFGNDKYYNKLPSKIKIAKIVTMDYLDELIKVSKKRCEDANNYHDINSGVRFSYLRVPVLIDEELFFINIDIKKVKGMNKFYIHYLEKKEFNLSQSHGGWLMDRLNSYD